MRRKKRLALLCAALWLAAGIAVTRLSAAQVRAEDYDTKLAAARLMQDWMDAVKGYKEEAGLPLVPEDIHQTGMIGEAYTPITTTHGAIEAKRTTAGPDMAALMVQLLGEAGIGPGDTVGAGFSGSFPAMDLAVLAACQTMGVKCVYIASVGASTYGANQPECTFPDMVYRLCRDGLLDQPPALVTPGGADDCGLDMDGELRERVLERIAGYGAEILREPDFETNLQIRMELYQQEGPIQCFIGVGGNLTTTGVGGQEVDCGLIPGGTIRAVDKNSGLLQRYNHQGLPVIHLLNIKKLVSDYGLPYDPESPPAIGESQVYFDTDGPKLPGLICLAGAAVTLWGGFRRGREGGGGK